MTKLKVPLLSLDARGRLASLFAFTTRRKQHIIESMPTPTDPQSSIQLFYRHMFTKCADLWHTLSEAEQLAWESSARPLHMTGYAFWMSQCLRPNPGIYLPLQGGTMSGDIDMAANQILDLPDPTLAQEPVTRAYYWANLPTGGYTEGARAHHTAIQTIPHATPTALSFNSERWDTDGIHDLIVFNSRLTAKTAGIYVAWGNVAWVVNFVGVRQARIRRNNAFNEGWLSVGSVGGRGRVLAMSIIDMALNDFIELFVYQTSGGNLNTQVAPNSSPEFAMQRIG